MKILIIYSTTDGHTTLICERLKKSLEESRHEVFVVLVDDAENLEFKTFDKIVIGASIRYGKHSPKIVTFIKKHVQLLESIPSAFFSVNVVARKPDKNLPTTNPYLIKFLKQIPWKPKTMAVFAGRIDYPSYGYFDRQMIRLIMWMTKGPTAPDAVVEFTDWNEVDKFGKIISTMSK
jgi:menaquinone-dependent protoporphyrinogen oxidase